MKLITLPKLRLGQLQTVGESSLNICQNIPDIAPEWTKANSSFAAFKEGMLKDQASAESKRKLDLKRDQIVSGFMKAADAEENFPNDNEQIKKTLEKLLKIKNKYGLNIVRLRRDEETSSIDNLLADIAQINTTSLASTGLLRWIPVLKDANDEYKQASQEYISDSTDADAILAASTLAPVLETDLEEMYFMLFAAIKRNPTDALKKAYADLEKLIESVK